MLGVAGIQRNNFFNLGTKSIEKIKGYMEIFKKNIKALELKDPELAELLSSTDAAPPAPEKSKSGEPTFRYGGLYFHSRYDPWKEVDAQIEEILAKESDWVSLFGLGYGYLLRRLVEKGHDKVIVYEPSIEILKGAFGEIDLAEIISMEKVFICNDVDSVISVMRENVPGDEDIMGYQSAPYRQLFSEELKLYTNKVQNAHITSRIGVSTEYTSRLKWVENYFGNLETFMKYPTVNTLMGRFKGVPLVIVGAGPSLARNARLLKDIKGKALIIAAITAYRPLIGYGVIPDFVICMEKVDLPEYFMDDDRDRRIRLILGDVSHPIMGRRVAKGKFIYFSPYGSLSIKQAPFWGVDYMPASGGSVTTVALDMGITFGCDPVIFIGQDLSFVDGKTHDDATVYKEHSVDMGADGLVRITYKNYMGLEGTAQAEGTSNYTIQWIKGLNGEMVPSKYDWVTFHQWFEDFAAHLKKSGSQVRLINATEGGAFIEGMEHITLATAIKRHVGDDRGIERILSDAERARSPVDYEGLLGSFGEMLEGTIEIGRLSGYILKEAVRVRKRFKKAGLHVDLVKSVDRIKKREKELFNKAEKVPFLWEALMAYTTKLKEYLKAERDEKEEEQFAMDLEATINIYKKVVEVAEKFRPILAEAIETVEKYEREPGQEALL